MDIAKELGDRFEKAGLVNIKTRAIPVPVNQGDKLGQLAWYVLSSDNPIRVQSQFTRVSITGRTFVTFS